MQTIPRSPQCVQPQPFPTAESFFTIEQLAEAAPTPRPAPAAKRAMPTSCESCGDTTLDLFGVEGTALCADCAANILAVR